MNIVITGASRGIGYELVKKLDRLNEHTIIAVSRNEDRLNKLKAECSVRVKTIAFDLNEINEHWLSFVNNLKDHISKIDILINNAGALVNKTFDSIEEDDFDQCYNTNVKAPFFLIQKCIPLFSKKAHILNISSMGGVQGSVKFAGLSAYSSSKGALSILTECLAEEFKETELSFNCLALGSAQTEMLEQAFPGYKAPMTAGEMAAFIADFALNGNKFFNGKILPVALTTP